MSRSLPERAEGRSVSPSTLQTDVENWMKRLLEWKSEHVYFGNGFRGDRSHHGF